MAQTNLNNLYPKPARDNTGTLITGVLLPIGGAPSGLPAGAFNSYPVDLVLVMAAATSTVTFDGSVPGGGVGHTMTAGVSEFWSLARARAAQFVSGGATTVQFSPFQL